MYTHHNNNKFNTKSNIIQLAQQIQQQTQYQNEARSIINAYRKIENLPAIHSNTQTKKKQPSKSANHHPTSQYANKVKQTLKQLNINRKKYTLPSQDILKNHQQLNHPIPTASQKHLIQSGLKCLFKILSKKYEEYNQIFIQTLIRYQNYTHCQQQSKIIKWKLKRIFNAWQYQIMLTKIQKQRIEKQLIEKQKRNQQLSISFYYFSTCKKILKKWSQQTKKAIKKKRFQQQQALQKQKQKYYIQQHNTKSSNINNIQLQNKVRGFIDDLKLSVQNKNKLNIIHEKSQQTYHQNQQHPQHPPQQPLTSISNPPTTQPPQPSPSSPPTQQPTEIQPQQRTPLSNEDLQKRRKQLQKKSKLRKQALDRLKRQKQQKKKLQQQQKNRIEKQLEIQSKKIKKQLYNKFLNQKKQRQQWEIRQKLINKQAQQFNLLRLKRYFGWLPWTKLKSSNQSNASTLLSTIAKILMKYFLHQLCNGIMAQGQQKLQDLQHKMSKYYSHKLSRKCLHHFQQNLQFQLAQKREYQIRHEFFTIKIYFASWIHARQAIQLQHYEWERPRIKKAESLHMLTLLHKSLKGFKLHRDESIQNKNIEEHKAIIKQKVRNIVQEKPTINYDDFL